MVLVDENDSVFIDYKLQTVNFELSWGRLVLTASIFESVSMRSVGSLAP